MLRRRLAGVLLAVMLLASVPATFVDARLVPNWPHERLMKESYLVVIARATANADSDEPVRSNVFKATYMGVNTQFEVEAVLKGKPRSAKIIVRHGRKQDGQEILNGPRHVTFRVEGYFFLFSGPEGAKIGLPAPQYLLFLKERKDGRYVFVSGPDDPDLSVREMFPANSATKVLNRVEQKRP